MPVTLEFDFATSGVADVVGEIEQITPALSDAGAAAEHASGGAGIGGMVGKIGDLGGKALSLVNPVGLAVNAVGFLGPKLMDAGKAAAAEQQEIDQLTNTLKNNTSDFNGNTAAIDGAVTAGQKKAFADSELRSTLGQLATDTGSVSEAMRLQSLAMDLARDKHISLTQASNLLGKADDESYAALAKLGIEIEKGTSREDALALVHQKTAGAADSFAASTEGAGIRASAAMDDALETIGGSVMPLLTEAMSGFADFLAGDTFNGAVSFVSDLLTNTLGPAFNFIKDLIQPLIDALSPLFTAVQNVGIGAGGTQGPLDGFKGMLDTVKSFILTNVIPAVGQIATFLADNLPAAIQFAKDAWQNVLQPAISNIWGFLKDNVLPILGQVANFLITNLPPAIQGASDLWKNTLQPALKNVWDFINLNVLPIFGQIGLWLSQTLPGVIQFATDSWNNVFKPALQGIWDFITNNVMPILKVLVDEGLTGVKNAFQFVSDSWNNVFKPALDGVWSFIDKNVIPILKTLVSEGFNKVKTAADGLAKFWNDTLAPAIHGVADAIGKVMDWLKKLADGLGSISLPDWLTPGSPTPWEIGLRGIADAMGDVSGKELPALAKGLEALPEPPVLSADLGSSGRGGRGGILGASLSTAPTNVTLNVSIDKQGNMKVTQSTLEGIALEANLISTGGGEWWNGG